MLELLAGHAVMALLAPALVRRWGPRALYVVAIMPAVAFGWALSHAAAVRDGEAVVQVYPWVPQLNQELAFHMTTFPWLMVLIVSGVGALVLAYSAHYFSPDSQGLDRYAAVFVAFAGAMFGLVVADDLLLLYVFWELTTVFSYLLIGHDAAKRASRRAAMQALLVTTLGGLAMLLGFIMLGQHAGSYRLSDVVADIPSGGYLSVALVLILLGALSKSAIFPFSFWLPAAMAAPTPVSGYLHAAAMVKAGVFLIGQLSPVFAHAMPWQPVVVAGGLLTMLLGGWTALRQTDLKLLAAYGTVSQLGMLTAVLGFGGRDAAVAGVALLTAHALFKAAIFLVVGIVHRTTGTRDLRQLSGLGRRRPLLLATAALAVASMIGLPPLIGFVAKEAALEAFWHSGDLLVLAGLVAGSALTVAYGLRFVWGAFADKADVADVDDRPAGAWFMAAPVLLASTGLAMGFAGPAFDRVLTPYADRYSEPPSGYELALWHGLSPALGFSALALTAGAVIFYLTRRHAKLRELRMPADGDRAYNGFMSWLDRAAVELTSATQRGSLPFYLGVILVALVLFSGSALLFVDTWPSQVQLFSSPMQLAAGIVVILSAIFAARASRRLTAVVLVTVAGYAVAALFVLHGAPDLALTQFLVETVTIVMFVLVLRRMPARFSERPVKMVRWARIAVGVAVGLVTSAMAYVAVGGREATPISVDFPELAYEFGGGKNVVNVTLVDIRVWDTMGEIAVLVVAATGVASLIFGHARALKRRGARRPALPPEGDTQWLAGQSPEAGRPAVILQVITRLLFHIIMLFSIFLLFSGHDNPGGGFAGGLVAGIALIVRYLAGGRQELNAAAPVDAGRVLGTGLFIAVGTGLGAMLFGGAVFQSAILDVDIPVLGNIHLVSSALFDIGVYLIVVGLALDILRSLGAEVDRQQENREDEVVDDEAENEGDESDEEAASGQPAVSDSKGPA